MHVREVSSITFYGKRWAENAGGAQGSVGTQGSVGRRVEKVPSGPREAGCRAEAGTGEVDNGGGVRKEKAWDLCCESMQSCLAKDVKEGGVRALGSSQAWRQHLCCWMWVPFLQSDQKLGYREKAVAGAGHPEGCRGVGGPGAGEDIGGDG